MLPDASKATPRGASSPDSSTLGTVLPPVTSCEASNLTTLSARDRRETQRLPSLIEGHDLGARNGAVEGGAVQREVRRLHAVGREHRRGVARDARIARRPARDPEVAEVVEGETVRAVRVGRDHRERAGGGGHGRRIEAEQRRGGRSIRQAGPDHAARIDERVGHVHGRRLPGAHARVGIVDDRRVRGANRAFPAPPTDRR